ncbi:GNAT family N-acetyltransferase [Vibrio tapetis]|uniref:N-acetyltransferase domain-containing protein n=1 Tax=Vibrio tapetis subsp. tapetis TaxID=1671868 RepID=A0A2N8ZA86_9VIBR|nr:GNAT family N-acetyltransferase [Vibrio tapetis]SON48824.1 conserved protein of unknown function [Vibrio tapetis subsp. tapetis]
MIAIKKAKIKYFSSLIELNVSVEQKGYVTTFDHLYENRSNEDVIYAITHDAQYVGFFALDFGFEKKYTFVKNHEIGLKNFTIDQRHQKNGYGKAAIKRLQQYLYSSYPDVASICVMVDKKNDAAYKCFSDAGFEDTKKIFFDDDSNQIRILRYTVVAP